jgi:hypothetical protein
MVRSGDGVGHSCPTASYQNLVSALTYPPMPDMRAGGYLGALPIFPDLLGHMNCSIAQLPGILLAQRSAVSWGENAYTGCDKRYCSMAEPIELTK